MPIRSPLRQYQQAQNAVRRVLARWMRFDVIVLDEVGYVPLADIGAEFLFQVIAERAERATLIITTNLPFSGWTQVFPNPRLCKALLDRITTALTSSRLERIRFASAARWRHARKRRLRNHWAGEGAQMDCTPKVRQGIKGPATRRLPMVLG